jgi:quercetin dioxygenase-like cupin family protein
MTPATTIPSLFYPAVQDLAIFDRDGPRPQLLLESARLTVLIAGLEPGQQIPAHPEAMAVYHFLAGDGVMTVDGREYAVTPGATIIAPPGATRGMRAESRLIFLATKVGA